MLQQKTLLILYLLGFTFFSACSSPKLDNGGKLNNPGSEPTPTKLDIINTQLPSPVLPTQISILFPDTPQPVLILSPTPLQTTISQQTMIQPTPSCTNQAEFIKDLTISNNTALDAGQPFAKIWRIKNSGTCIWNNDYTLTFFSGEPMGGQPSIPFGSVVQPGETADLRVSLVAPLNQSTHTGDWVLKDASGHIFGIGEAGNLPLSVTILVKPTPKPTSGCVKCGIPKKP